MKPASGNGKGKAATGGRKAAWRLTAFITAVLLMGVAVAVTHNRAQPPKATVVAAQGGLIKQPPPPPAAEVPRAETPKPKGDYAEVGFDRLAAFPTPTKWVMTDPIRIKGVQQLVGGLPDSIKALDRNRIAVTGFMLPCKMTDGLVSDFFLMRTQARCCFGLPIKVNELLTVHMTGVGVKSLMDQPVTVFGTLHIAETRDDSTGALNSIYQLDGERMVQPSHL